MAETIQLGSFEMEWRGDEFLDRANSAVAIGLTDAAELLARNIKRNIGKQGPPRSSPGQYPRMDTTTLNKSIDSTSAKAANLVAKAGVRKDAAYDVVSHASLEGQHFRGEVGSHRLISATDVALWLEFKAPSRGGRPFMVRSLVESKKGLWDRFTVSTRTALAVGYNENKRPDIRPGKVGE